MTQAGKGRVVVDSDFGGQDDVVALTAVDGSRHVGPFRVVGQGLAEADSGAPAIASALGGAVRLTTTNEDAHTLGLETDVMWDVGLMGTLVAEARVQAANLTTKRIFFGFTDIAIASYVPDIEVDIGVGATATLTLTASDICGFILDSELTAGTAWHSIYNGGSTTGVTASATNVLSPVHTAGEWQVLRVEIDNNGTARFSINGEVKQTVVGAASTTVDMKAFLAVGASAATIATLDVDYLSVSGNRDWTA